MHLTVFLIFFISFVIVAYLAYRNQQIRSSMSENSHTSGVEISLRTESDNSGTEIKKNKKLNKLMKVKNR